MLVFRIIMASPKNPFLGVFLVMGGVYVGYIVALVTGFFTGWIRNFEKRSQKTQDTS